MKEIKLYFNNGLNSIDIPEKVQIIQDHGVIFTCLVNGPKKRIYGKVLTVRANQEVLDNWLKDKEVYVL